MTKPPKPWLQTLRLELREFVPADVDDLYRLDSDPRVVKYLGGEPLSREEVEANLRRIRIGYRANYGLGIWRAARRDSGAFIGWFCLKYMPKSTDVEVGYRLVPEAWGQGFATEGAQALVAYGFDDLGLYKIVGVTHRDNRASQRVLVKAGLNSRGWSRYYARRVRLFVAERDPA
ncbi:MAG: GNAT family N-acetyltransferase [Betaproteobacteria bacterium]|nr:GNAT family N-acetyltransferase [Betaproteobacteria bacterium]